MTRPDTAPASSLWWSGRRAGLPRGLRRGAALVPAGVLLALVVAGWELYVELSGIRDIILPPPSAVFSSLWSHWGVYQPELAVTAIESLKGFALAIGASFVLAIAVTASRVLRLAVYPLIIATQAMPVIAIGPLFITWFGFGQTSKVLVSALIAFFPITVSTVAGLMSLDDGMVALMRSFPAGRVQIFLRARLPNALPQIFSGLKVGAVLSVVGAVVGEWIGSDSGLGHLIIRANASFAIETVFGAIVLLSGLGIAFFVAVASAEWLFLPWNRKSQ